MLFVEKENKTKGQKATWKPARLVIVVLSAILIYTVVVSIEQNLSDSILLILASLDHQYNRLIKTLVVPSSDNLKWRPLRLRPIRWETHRLRFQRKKSRTSTRTTTSR